jgi:hypothetical protein
MLPTEAETHTGVGHELAVHEGHQQLLHVVRVQRVPAAPQYGRNSPARLGAVTISGDG